MNDKIRNQLKRAGFKKNSNGTWDIYAPKDKRDEDDDFRRSGHVTFSHEGFESYVVFGSHGVIGEVDCSLGGDEFQGKIISAMIPEMKKWVMSKKVKKGNPV